MLYFVKVIKGLSTSDYIFENTIHLPPNPNKVNRVVRIFRVEDTTVYQSDSSQTEGSFSSITEVIPYKLYYPNCALIGTTLDARSFQQIPNRKFDLKLLKVKVPSKVSSGFKFPFLAQFDKSLTDFVNPNKFFSFPFHFSALILNI